MEKVEWIIIHQEDAVRMIEMVFLLIFEPPFQWRGLQFILKRREVLEASGSEN